MNTLAPPAANQWIETAMQAIDQTFNSMKERVVKVVRFIIIYRGDLTLLAFIAFSVLSIVYLLFFAPPAPPCVDIVDTVK